jgi:hypothetical protein
MSSKEQQIIKASKKQQITEKTNNKSHKKNKISVLKRTTNHKKNQAR